MPIQKSQKISFEKMRSIFFFGLIGALSIAMIYLFRPFFYPIFWAAVIAILFHPIYRYLLRIFKSSVFTSFLTILLFLIIILLPLSGISTLVVKESQNLYTQADQSGLFQNLQNPDTVSTWLTNTPLSPYADVIKEKWTVYISDATEQLTNYFVKNIQDITATTLKFLKFLAMIFVMLYTAFYFLKDGERILKRLMHMSPLGDTYEEMLYKRFTSTVRATLKGTFIIGGIQGILGGILFWITGIPGALIWGIVMIVIGIIPAIGPSLILGVGALVMLAFGNIWQAVVLIIAAVVISFIDNLLRPPLVGKDTQIHPLIIFFSTLGGLLLFDISGFVIGPVIAALYISIMNMYDHYYKNELKKN